MLRLREGAWANWAKLPSSFVDRVETLPHHLLEMPDAVLTPSCNVMGIDHELAGLIANRVQPALDAFDERKIFLACYLIYPSYSFLLCSCRFVGIEVEIPNLCCLLR